MAASLSTRAGIVREDAPVTDPAPDDVPRLRTARLLLRGWRDADREPFAALNAEPEVAAWLSRPLDRAASDAFVDRMIERWSADAYGLWAVERLEDGALIGMTGLSRPSWAPEPSVEIGWRLASATWGHGYATEAALAAAGFAFGEVGLEDIVSYTAALNVRSRAVMERLGMTLDPSAGFDYAGFAEGHRLRPHVTYRLARSDWASRRPVS
jgi:ribosomal-protein-alanine N-acetyltransferase